MSAQPRTPQSHANKEHTYS